MLSKRRVISRLNHSPAKSGLDVTAIHPVSDDAVERAAGGGECIDAAGDLRVFDQRRGVVGLDAGVDHQRAAAAPVFLWVKESMPSMSAAGFERVNVTQRKLRSDPATNWLSSTTTIRRKGERRKAEGGRSN